MIIQRVDADRLHRYRVLRLADLPERGIIALSGDNESGKSGIGEIICFALFGRTYALAWDRIGKLVHWGAGQGAVTLRFRAKGRNYKVIRQLTRDGEQSARLLRTEDPEEPVARGTDAVTGAIKGILGYGFDAYVETFYLAQREITMPQPHSPAVRAMVGIVPLERCEAELIAEAEGEEGEIGRIQERTAELDAGLSALSPDHARLDELEASLDRIAEQERETSDCIAALEAGGDAYCDACRGKGSHRLRRALTGFLANLTLLILLATTGFWSLLRFRPDAWPTPGLRVWSEPVAAAVGLPLETAILYLGYALAGFLIFLWVWLVVLGVGTRRRRASGRRLSQALDRIDALDPAAMPASHPPDVAAVEYEIPLEASRSMDKPDAERRSRLQQRILGLEAAATEVRAALAHEAAWLRRRLSRLGTELHLSQAKFERARADRLRHGELVRERAELDTRLADLHNRVEVRRLACRLLDGAARDMSERFNEHLRGMVSRALPQFTEGRYDHLAVDEDLQVRVYSGDKRNLLDLDEISSGTQRQIMLALRLGLSQELVSRLVGDDQFAFLDEPFAFFDGRRMRAALKTLSELGGDVVQHWVVAQRFPQDVHIGIEIPCGRHPDSLEIGRPDTD